MVMVGTLEVMKKAEISTFGRLLAWTAGLATLMVLPTSAYDPINVPKLLVIAIGGFMAFGGLIAQRKTLSDPKYRLVLIFGGAFIADLILVLVVSGTNFNQEFFGTFGRATGFVAYASLTFLLVAAAISAQADTLSKVSWALVITGALSIVYGLLQSVDADPVNWVSSYNPVIGFLGNPNFQSSFVGFNGILVFALLLNKKYSTAVRLFLLIDLLLSAYVITSTDSQQGILVLAGGVSIVGFIWITTSKVKFLSIPLSIAGLIGAVFVALGSLNSGPLAGLLYKASVTYRGDYWRAGWKMTAEHPFFGVGLDSYGDWYRRARTVEATLRRGPDVVSNAAHNVLLDLSSNGGFPLVIIYLFMVTLVFISSVKVFRRAKDFNPLFTGLFAVWIAYLAQSIISLNQLGLVVWGWIISGLLIGYEINTRADSRESAPAIKQSKGKSASAMAQQKVTASVLVGMFVGGLVGLGLGLPPVVASTKLLTALNSQDPKLVQQAAYIWPRDARFMYQIADILVNNKLMAEARVVSDDSIKKFTEEYGVWAVRSRIEGLPQPEIDRALSEMKRLDPNNPNLK
jgi:O-antigen ligase